MASIIQEQFSSKFYELQRDCQNKSLAQLNFENVARVEAMIQMDSHYNRSGNPNAIPNAKYKGSTAYWFSQLKEILIYKKTKASCNKSLHDIIAEVVNAIDRDNSTRLSVGNSRVLISNYLYSNSQNLVSRLQNRVQGFQLVRDIASSNNNNKGRENYSFATKFCHYACFYLFEGTSNADNYSIYDNVVSNVLLDYADRYGILNPTNGKKYTNKDYNRVANYDVYSSIIDAIIQKSGADISRNGFDHLLWYFHKS